MFNLKLDLNDSDDESDTPKLFLPKSTTNRRLSVASRSSFNDSEPGIVMLDENIKTPKAKNMKSLASFLEEFKKFIKKVDKITAFEPKIYVIKLKKTYNELKKKLNIKTCPKMGEIADQGAFGSIEINKKKHTVTKLTDLVTSLYNDFRSNSVLVSKKTLKNTILKISRLEDLCSHMSELIESMFKLFPNNVTRLFKCSECLKNGQLYHYMVNDLKEGKNLQKLLPKQSSSKSKGKLSSYDITKIEIQLIYIAETLNDNRIFHNDYAARNIMIDMSKRVDMVYKQNDNYKLTVKNTFLPILIDYDLMDDVQVTYTNAGERDFDIYMIDSSSKGLESKARLLYDAWKDKDIDTINDDKDILIKNKPAFLSQKTTFKTFFGNDAKKSISKKPISKKSKSSSRRSLRRKSLFVPTGGGKKIRKHKGINKQTGKLNKGYKYSGKKLKSGIPQIIKINKKK